MILEFYGKECSHCVAVAPVVERLKSEGMEIEQYEVWHNEEHAARQREYDRGRCNAVPFFVNTKTDRFICGEADYDELKALAQ